MVPVTGTLNRKKKNEVACSENIIQIFKGLNRYQNYQDFIPKSPFKSIKPRKQFFIY